MNYYIDSVRTADGYDNVLLVDAGDCLQGDNAAYYYNYVDTVTPHLYPRLVEYMHYDAIAMGNHDIETGHPVYDRVQKGLTAAGAPFMAANAIRNDNGKSYFPAYRMVVKAGLRIAVLGYNNANIKAWLAEDLWSGMHFESIAARIQQDVDYVREKEQPDVVIAAMQSGCGHGDGTVLEAEALDAFNLVKGVDWLICGHDHRPYVENRDTTALLNSLLGSGMQAQPQQTRLVGKEFPQQQVEDGQRKAGEDELREAKGGRGAAEESHKGDGQVTLQGIHAAAPGHEVAGVMVTGSVYAIMEQGEGLVPREGLVLIQPAGDGPEANDPNGHADQDEKPNAVRSTGKTGPSVFVFLHLIHSK